MLRQTALDSVTTIFLQRDEALANLRDIAATIAKEHAEVVSVRLFGALARGDQVGTSDADILMVVRGNRIKDPVELIRVFYAYFRLPIPVDILVYSEDQINGRLRSKDPHFARLWNESVELMRCSELKC